MSRLRNRMVKAEFWTDPELLRWPLAKRLFYQGLWAVAEDSGCLEDDPFGWKLQLFPSPIDSSVTVEMLTEWRDELVAAGKLFRYDADGKCYLYIRTFHQHEHPRNPQRPDLPLPTWLHHDTSVVKRGDGTFQRNAYDVTTESLELPNGGGSVTLPSPPPRLAPSRVPKGTRGKGRGNKSPAPPLSEERPEPMCVSCGKLLSPDELADETLTAGDGNRFWHKSCSNGDPSHIRDAIAETLRTAERAAS